MTTVTPDFAGFDDAQRRFRAAFARDVVVHTTESPSYPPGTVLDPESGEPHDPTIAPTSGGGDVSQVISARVIGGAFTGTATNEETDALGLHSLRDVALVLDPELYDDVANATSFDFDNESYQVQRVVTDVIAQSQRVIVYGRAE
jgi:hypothetical protein